MILAFDEGDLPDLVPPQIGSLEPLDPAGVRTMAIPEGKNPLPKGLQSVRIRGARQPGPIGSRHGTTRMPQPLNESPVSGEEEETGGVQIQPANGLHPIP
jgi:hypothetical protein